MLSGEATDVLIGTGIFTEVAPLVAATALLRAGDSLTPGGILVGTADAARSGTSPSTTAPFRAQSLSVGGFGAIGLLCQNFWGCALGAYQNGLSIATSNGNFQQLTDQTGKIIGAALAAGAAVTNLGYTPLNSAGGQYGPMPNPLALIKDVGLGAASYSLAALRVQSVTSAGRAQIGFYNPPLSIAASLYYESDQTFRYVRADGSTARLHDTLHGIALGDLVGFTPLTTAGITVNQPALGANCFVFQSDMGVAANSFEWAQLQVTTITTASGSRPGIGFQHRGVVGAFLYLDSDGLFKFIRNDGSVHVISSS
jgi:hypothetical protein